MHGSVLPSLHCTSCYCRWQVNVLYIHSILFLVISINFLANRRMRKKTTKHSEMSWTYCYQEPNQWLTWLFSWTWSSNSPQYLIYWVGLNTSLQHSALNSTIFHSYWPVLSGHSLKLPVFAKSTSSASCCNNEYGSDNPQSTLPHSYKKKIR